MSFVRSPKDILTARRLLDKCRRVRDKTPSNADNMALVGMLSTQLVHQQLLRGGGPLSPPPEARRPRGSS